MRTGLFSSNRHSQWTRSSTVLSLIFIFFNHSIHATEQTIDCNEGYTKLSKQHADTVARYKANSAEYFNSLHEIENSIFETLQYCPKDTLLFTLMGETQISLGNLQLAAIYAEQAYRRNPNIWQTHHILGTTLSMQKEFEKGLQHLEQAAAIAKERPILVFNLCSTYHAAKDYNNAIAACSKIIKRRDHQLHGAAYHIRGLSYEALEMNQKAKRDFTKAHLLGYN